MSTEDNKDLIRKFHAAMERGDSAEELISYWATNAANHASGRAVRPPGGEGVINIFRSLRIAFPDRRWQIDDLIAEGDMVCCRMTLSGTFGELPPTRLESTFLMETASTGKPYSNVHHIHIFRVVDGKITEHWAARDDLDLLMQLGVISRPTARAANQDGDGTG